MTITITSIKLRSILQTFRLIFYTVKIITGLKKHQGFIEFKTNGFGYMHYTMSAWESDADMKKFVPTKAHLDAMKNSRKIASEIRTYTFQGNALPEWKEAKQLVAGHGKLLTYN
jgi:hypothetical protein